MFGWSRLRRTESGNRNGDSQQAPYPGERFWREAHRALQLIIPLENIGLPFPTAKGFPIDLPTHPSPMAVDRNRIITAVHHSIYQRFTKALRRVAAANRHVEGAGVAVKIWEAFGHAGENVEVFGIEQPTPGGAMGGDDIDAAFQWQRQDARIGVLAAEDGDSMFT